MYPTSIHTLLSLSAYTRTVTIQVQEPIMALLPLTPRDINMLKSAITPFTASGPRICKSVNHQRHSMEWYINLLSYVPPPLLKAHLSTFHQSNHLSWHCLYHHPRASITKRIMYNLLSSNLNSGTTCHRQIPCSQTHKCHTPTHGNAANVANFAPRRSQFAKTTSTTTAIQNVRSAPA